MINNIKIKNKNAFTLMELMVVIAILGVLSTLMTGNFLTSIKRSRDAQRKNDLSTIQRALEMYYEDNKTYPTGEGATNGLINFGNAFCHPDPDGCTTKTYMQKMPNDPLANRRYQYFSDTGTNYRIYACMENNQMVVPVWVNAPANICTTTSCKRGETSVECVWAVSDSNSSP